MCAEKTQIKGEARTHGKIITAHTLAVGKVDMLPSVLPCVLASPFV
jgi:hypothetical protein